MGIMYSVEFNSVAVTAVQDLFQIEAVTVPVKIHEITISQDTDYGDAEAEGLLIQVRTEITDAVTDDLAAVPLNGYRTTANLCNLAINETTQITTAAVDLYSEVWNLALPWKYIPTPKGIYTLAVGDALVVDLASAPTDSITCSGTMIFEEL